MIPTVNFCGLDMTRLVIGANPFGGFSHQNPRRDQEMLAYYTIDRILETWNQAESAGINTMVTNNESAHVVEAVKRYLDGGGGLQWIAQVNHRLKGMEDAIREVVDLGCKALYIHGGVVDDLYLHQDTDQLENWINLARSLGVPVGVAGHDPAVHLWVNGLDIVDFHAVCFFNCGSLHSGKGERFHLDDPPRAVETIREIKKPCIAYKIMGAGRIDPRMAFEYAFDHIKMGDIVNVGMYRGDQDDMVAMNAAMVRELLVPVV